MKDTFGEILEVDEQLNHQIAEPFSVVSQTDLGWTEKIWGTIAKRDGTLQANFGLGKYQNRNIVDGFAGIAQNLTQRIVRASRELSANMRFESSYHGKASGETVGPLIYEVIEPLKKVLFKLDANDAQPIAYELEFQGDMPCFFEDKQSLRDARNKKVHSDVIRYHQMGTAKGWIEIEGKRHDVKPDEWFAVRDHSWGIRPAVGAQPHDLQPAPKSTDPNFYLHWSPIMLIQPDGTKYSFQYFFMRRSNEVVLYTGYLNHMDGTQERVARVRPELDYDPVTRQPIKGKIHFDMLLGGTRTVDIETQENGAGFHLGPGGYSPMDGFHHGSWRGELHIEGECYENLRDTKTMRQVRQLRDGIITAREGDAKGYGIFESTVIGEWAEFGLGPDTPMY